MADDHAPTVLSKFPEGPLCAHSLINSPPRRPVQCNAERTAMRQAAGSPEICYCGVIRDHRHSGRIAVIGRRHRRTLNMRCLRGSCTPANIGTIGNTAEFRSHVRHESG
jgi:hypothetical protein